MFALVVYDSVHGNTKSIAEAISAAVAGRSATRTVGEVSEAELESLDLLFIGAPTHGGQPSEPMRRFLGRMPATMLHGTKVAVFDTRLTAKLLRVFGYAAPKIAEGMRAKGAILVGSPEGFFVSGRRGPLKEGERERAAEWARSVVAAAG